MFIEMKQKDIRVLKEKIWLLNGKKCPVLGKEIALDKMALDHNHKRNDEPYSEHKGTIRTSLDWRANAILGKLENALKRTGLEFDEGFDLPTFLRNAADYFEAGPYIDENGDMLIHPKELPKPKKLSKKNFNRCKKLYDNEVFVPKRKNQKKKPFPDFPKNGKAIKLLKELFERFDVPLYN